MERYSVKNKSAMIRLAAVCLLLTGLIGAAVGYLLYQHQSAQDPAEAVHGEIAALDQLHESEEQVSPPAHTIDFNRLKTDDEYRQVMQKRKETFGIDASVDLIVKADEDIKIGDTTVPMSEILEKIRLKSKDGIVEQDIPSALSQLTAAENEIVFQDRLQQIQAKTDSLITSLSSPPSADNIEAYQQKMNEYRRLRSLAEDFEQFRSIQQEILAQETLLEHDSPTIYAAITRHAAELTEQLKNLHIRLHDLLPDIIPSPADIDQHYRLFDSLKLIEARLAELETQIDNPDIISQPTAYQQAVNQYARLIQAVPLIQQYRTAERQLDDYRDILNDGQEVIKERLSSKTEALRTQRDILEHELRLRAMPVLDEVYGIYVVQPGDNVWNIHFAFLTEYFRHKNIILLPRDDQPDSSGRSSGVGRILKFSETMVSIYNLREQNLSLDLNLIHPLSKIVVFDLGKAFSLLDQIDYTNLSLIKFDGETLWMPARNECF